MNISGAIFDLDGTLLDTTEIWEGVAARYITSLRKTPEPGLREKTKAMTLPMLCSYLKDEYRIATTESKIAKGFNTILREDYLESADIKQTQYVPILLEKFKQKGVAMCITTSTDKAIANEILVRLGIRDYFTFIMTCEEAGGDKESPKVFLDAQKKLGTPKDETIVVEDGLLAIRGAKEADFYVIAVADKNEEQNKAEIQELSDRYIKLRTAVNPIPVSAAISKTAKSPPQTFLCMQGLFSFLNLLSFFSASCPGCRRYCREDWSPILPPVQGSRCA